MKLWVKYLIGCGLGIVLAFLLPENNPAVAESLSFITNLIIRFASYLVLPLVFFTAIISVQRLRESHLILKTIFWSAFLIIASALVLTFISLVAILIVRLPRIPITAEKTASEVAFSFAQFFEKLFPPSAFETLVNGSFLFPSFLIACFLGGAAVSDENTFKPIIVLSDSLSKLLYNVSSAFIEFASIGMIAIMAKWFIEFRHIIFATTFLPLIIMLFALFIFVAFVVWPLAVFYLCHDSHPYRILYASLAPIIAAFVSGNANFVLPLALRCGKESLGIKRRINGISYPLFSFFGRSGSAIITALGFIVIWRSYVQDLPAGNIPWIFFMSILLSFFLSPFPSGGAFISLAFLCTLYGKGFENAELLLKPASVILCSFAASFDALEAMFASYIIAVKTKMIEHHAVKHFI